MFPRKPNPVPTSPASVSQAGILTGPGVTAGAAIGAAAGATAGTVVIPGLGTIGGALLGGVTGAVLVDAAGGIAGNRLGRYLDTRLLNQRIAEERDAADKRSIEAEVTYEASKIAQTTSAYFERLDTTLDQHQYVALWKKLDALVKQEKNYSSGS